MADDMPVIDEGHPVSARDAEDDLKVYLEFGINQSDMGLLLQLALASPMSLKAEKLYGKLADMLEVVHPHHAGAFIVRGCRAESENNFTQAAEMYLIGMEADLRADESAILLLNMLTEQNFSDSELAEETWEFLQGSEEGRDYLEEFYPS